MLNGSSVIRSDERRSTRRDHPFITGQEVHLNVKSDVHHNRGQIAIILTLAVPALIGAIAFGTDIALLYINWAQLQKNTDTAVMVGAAYLPSDPADAVSAAENYLRKSGNRDDEIVATRIGPDRSTLSMTVRRNVTLVTRFLGMGPETIAANSTAIVNLTRLKDGHAYRLNASRSDTGHAHGKAANLRRHLFA